MLILFIPFCIKSNQHKTKKLGNLRQFLHNNFGGIVLDILQNMVYAPLLYKLYFYVIFLYSINENFVLL